MNLHFMITLGVAAMVFVLFVFIAVWARSYVKVGPNQALIVSGRKVRRADGTWVGFRVVKGGGTFVFPLLERAEVLSLAVLALELPRSKLRTAQGVSIEVECVAQVKVESDDVSISAAAEYFLGKSTEAIKDIIRPVLANHLHAVVGSLSSEQALQDGDACAAAVQTAASVDLAKMGLSVISLTVRLRPAG